MPQIFNNAVMTDNGRALLSKEIAGECMIQITRMSIGSGVYTAAEKDPDTLQKMTALKNEMQSTGLSSLKRQDNTSVIVTGIFTNDNLETAYNINEIGLYAQEKGNRSTEILYSVAVIAEEQGEIMPASEGKNPVRIIQDWVVSVANSANATIEYLPDGAFAMASQVGNVDDLNTKAKENLVDAANELLENTITNNKRIEALENPNFKEPQDDEDPEKAIEQIIPGKPVLELYKNIKSALKGILVVAKKALNIATGKNQARVFATVADLDAWLAVQDNVKKLNVGDNFYIVATDVPDYWWDGTAKQELEVQKIDLTTYDNAITALRSKDEELKQSVAKAISKTAILNTKEQISANTSADNIVGALALKVAMAEYTNQFSQINSNMVYKSGDTIGNRNTLMWLFGTITTGGREIYTFIPFNKPIVGTCNFNLIDLVIRHNDSYVFESFSTDDIAVVKIDVLNFANSGLYIKLYKDGGVNWYAAMNNDILSVAIKFTVTIS